MDDDFVLDAQRLKVPAEPAGVLLFVLDKTLGLRVSREQGVGGLDHHEHNAEAYGIPLTTRPEPQGVAVAK